MDWDCYEHSQLLLIIHIRTRMRITRNPHHCWQDIHFELPITTIPHQHLSMTMSRRKRTYRTILLDRHSHFGLSLPCCVVFPMVRVCWCVCVRRICMCQRALTHSHHPQYEALYNIFIKLGSYSIHPVLGGVLLQFVAALLGLILLALQHVSQQHQPPLSSISSSSASFNNDKGNQDNDQDNDNQQLLEYDRPGILWSICAGIAVGAAEMLSFFVSSRGVPAVHSIPVIIGGSVLFGTILGCALLQENLSPRGWCGVAMLVAGIVLVGTD